MKHLPGREQIAFYQANGFVVIEDFLAPEELERALAPEMARAFTAIFKPLGFHYVTLDMEGYRQGSLNAVLG